MVEKKKFPRLIFKTVEASFLYAEKLFLFVSDSFYGVEVCKIYGFKVSFVEYGPVVEYTGEGFCFL